MMRQLLDIVNQAVEIPLRVHLRLCSQREAIQALVLSGSEAAARILLQALASTSGRPRQTLISELTSMRDERVILLCWELGEGDHIEWWHEVEAGYTGGQPL